MEFESRRMSSRPFSRLCLSLVVAVVVVKDNRVAQHEELSAWGAALAEHLHKACITKLSGAPVAFVSCSLAVHTCSLQLAISACVL